MASRGNAGDDAKGVFLGGARSPRPQIRAGRKPGEVIATHGSARGRWPKGGQYWVWRNAFLAGVRSPPLRGEAEPCTESLAGKGRRWRERRFSRRDALRASAWHGPDPAVAKFFLVMRSHHWDRTRG